MIHIVNPRVSVLGMTGVGGGLNNAGAFLCYDLKRRWNSFERICEVNAREVLQHAKCFTPSREIYLKKNMIVNMEILLTSFYFLFWMKTIFKEIRFFELIYGGP